MIISDVKNSQNCEGYTDREEFFEIADEYKTDENWELDIPPCRCIYTNIRIVFNDLNIERFCSLISLTISTFSPKIKINNPMATIGTKIPAPIR
jgi:hypothetical protein